MRPTYGGFLWRRALGGSSFSLVNRVYDYRLDPTPAQARSLESLLESLRLFFNAALEERRAAYRQQGRTIRLAEQEKSVKEIKALCPAYDAIHTHLYQDVLTRLQGAFDAFFRRLKAGEKPGFPRFKPFGRYDSFTFKDAGNGRGARLSTKDGRNAGAPFPAVPGNGQRLFLAGIGRVKIKLHRVYEGRVKQVRVVRKSDGHWYAQFVCADVPAQPLPATGENQALDVGITDFATMRDGSTIPNPRCFEQAEAEIAKAARRVARRQKGSAGRKEAVLLLAKAHARVAARRRQFHHETAKALVAKYDFLFVEDLNVKGLARGFLAKQVQDAAWAAFILILVHKAERAGREVVKVAARGTSQECSGEGCGKIVPKALHVRVHHCPHCGLRIGRDHNSARIIYGRGTAIVEGRAVGSPVKREAPTLTG